MKLTSGELNQMDFGSHMGLMEEWNEDSQFEWGEAWVHYGFPHTTVVHQFAEKGGSEALTGFMVAVYLTDGEGDILSLRAYDRWKSMGVHDYIGKAPEGSS